MIKTFLFGILLGLGLAFGALYALPVVDQVRESSIVSVAANGGNSESFHINIPMDRIMVGDSADSMALPPNLEWPDLEVLGDVQVELFKVRNARDAVIGVAARAATTHSETNINSIEWLLHFPARGSLFVDVNPTLLEGGYRLGELRTGSRELQSLVGNLTERWVADENASEVGEEKTRLGRIELSATYVAPLEEVFE